METPEEEEDIRVESESEEMAPVRIEQKVASPIEVYEENSLEQAEEELSQKIES